MTPHAQPFLRKDGKPDGRTLRKLHTRLRILTAVRGFANDGQYRPRAVDVAERAGVSTRSIFQIFHDVAEMRTEALTDEHVKTLADQLRALTDSDLVSAFHRVARRKAH